MTHFAHLLQPPCPPQWQGPSRKHWIETQEDAQPVRTAPPGPKPSKTHISVVKQRRNALEAILRTGELVTADDLAERLEVSERTIRRDIAKLQDSGITVLAEAGMGYQLRGKA